MTQSAQDFKAAWLAKYGKWEDPNISYATNFPALITAIQQAGSLDTEKVAAVLSSGLKFETPLGTMQMISRPDMGNDRTIDSVGTYYIKQIHNQKSELIATISPEEASAYMKTAFPALPPGATPPGPPPAEVPPASP